MNQSPFYFQTQLQYHPSLLGLRLPCSLLGFLTQKGHIVGQHSFQLALLRTLLDIFVFVLQHELYLLCQHPVQPHQHHQLATDSRPAGDQIAQRLVDNLHHPQPVLQALEVLLGSPFFQGLLPHILHVLAPHLEQLLQLGKPFLGQLGLHPSLVEFRSAHDQHEQHPHAAFVDRHLFVYVFALDALPHDHREEVLQPSKVDELLSSPVGNFGPQTRKGVSDGFEGREGVLGFALQELQHHLVALHLQEDQSRFQELLGRVDEQDVQAVEQVTQELLFVAAFGGSREVGPDRFHQDLHPAEPVEHQLSLLGVGQQVGQHIAPYVLVVVDDFVPDHIVGHDAVGQVLQQLGFSDQQFH